MYVSCTYMYVFAIGKMSNLFNQYLQKLSQAISNPSSLAIAFHSRNIIDQVEQIAITEVSNTRTTQDRTNDMLNTVSRRLNGNEQKLRTVVEVLYEHLATQDIAREIARVG